MQIEQYFDPVSSTYTYLLSDPENKVAAIIDPVAEHAGQYLNVVDSRGLSLVKAMDTHVHADHVTGLGRLRDATGCETYVGIGNEVACATGNLEDKMHISIGAHELLVLFTPGHTDDSFCFYYENKDRPAVFTGDTLLINGCGRTDFQNGDAHQLYHSLHDTVLRLPDHTIVYPAHDYAGNKRSTIAREKANNPRLQLGSEQAFVEFMENLDLPDPKMMDIAVPLNLGCGVEGDNG